jgi:hypothetical protein
MSISAASLAMRPRESRCSIASSSSILSGNFLDVELTANRQHLGQPFDRGRAVSQVPADWPIHWLTILSPPLTLGVHRAHGSAWVDTIARIKSVGLALTASSAYTLQGRVS